MPTIPLPGTGDAWIDTGVIVETDATIIASCAGSYYWNPFSANGGGLFPASESPGAQLHLFPATSGRVNIYGAALLLLPLDAAPGAHPADGGPQYTDGVFGFPFDPDAETVDIVLPPDQIAAGASSPGPWRLWAIISDDQPDNNAGGLTLTIAAGSPPDAANGLTATPGRLSCSQPVIILSGT